MAVVSGAGLFFHELYQDNALIASSWYGNDLVTLVVATPLLVVALLGAWGGSRRAFLVWMGLVAYSLYNSAFYLFRATFNSLFLVYALLFTLSSFALGFGLLSLDATALYRQVQSDLPVRWISGFMVFVAVALGDSTGPSRSGTSPPARGPRCSTRWGRAPTWLRPST